MTRKRPFRISRNGRLSVRETADSDEDISLEKGARSSALENRPGFRPGAKLLIGGRLGGNPQPAQTVDAFIDAADLVGRLPRDPHPAQPAVNMQRIEMVLHHQAERHRSPRFLSVADSAM